MSYGLRVDGTDSGGTFIVTDTDKNLVNLQVVEVGTATHVLNLDSPLGPTDFLFVRNPSAANGSYETFSKLYNTLNGYQHVSFTHPQFYYCVLNTARTQITFQGGALDAVDFGYQSGPVGIVYRGFDVKFDYFIVRDVGEIIADGLQATDDYGLQVFTSNGDIAFDSRAVITNNTFAINSAAQPGGSSSPSTNTSLFTFGESNSYVNIEWTAFGAQFHSDGIQDTDGGLQGAGVYLRGAGITNSGCYIYDGFLDAEPGVGFYWFPVQYAVYGATLHTGAPAGGGTSGGGTTSGGDGTGGSSNQTATGTLDINSTTFLEGEDIVFTATTTISGNYNIQIQRISGESGSGEFTDPHTTFNGTTKTHTVPTFNDSVKELGWQGEEFTATLRTGNTVGSGTSLDSVSFTLYDNDGYTTLVGATSSKYTIASDDTFAAPIFFYQSQGTTGSIPARIRLGTSSGTIIKTFNLPDGVNQTVQIDTNLPPELSTFTYVLQLYTGSDAEGWRDARTFYIEREQDSGLTGTIPTSSATPSQGSQVIAGGEIDYSQTFTGMTAGEQIQVVNTSGVAQSSIVDVPAGTSPTSITINGIPSGSAGTTVTHRARVRRNLGNWVNKATYTVTRQQLGSDNGNQDDFGGGLD